MTPIAKFQNGRHGPLVPKLATEASRPGVAESRDLKHQEAKLVLCCDRRRPVTASIVLRNVRCRLGVIGESALVSVVMVVL